jgi:23S rRNA pseudouridine955/2504/2580 synthase
MDFEHVRLDKIVRRLCNGSIPQSVIEKAIRKKHITVNSQRAMASMQVFSTDDIYIHESLKKYVTPSQNTNVGHKGNFEELIIYEDDNIIAINKPAELAAQLGTNTRNAVDVMAKDYNPNSRLVHRIDKRTSGIMMLSKTLEMSRFMLHMFQSKSIHKKYLAVVSSKNLNKNTFTVNIPLLREDHATVVDQLNGLEAITSFKLLKRLPKDLAIVEAFPKTGRTHQIRVHLRYIGCPILGDDKYGGRNYKKLCLHAHKMTFVSIDKRKISITADPPAYILNPIHA